MHNPVNSRQNRTYSYNDIPADTLKWSIGKGNHVDDGAQYEQCFLQWSSLDFYCLLEITILGVSAASFAPRLSKNLPKCPICKLLISKYDH